ncbi:MAG: GNAT family protein [Bacteroidales bacterium]
MVITGTTIQLRPFKESDDKKVALLCNNRNLSDNLRDQIPFPYTEQDARVFISFCLGQNPQVTFAIEYQQELAGCIGLVLQNDIYRLSAEIGYWIGEPYWGKGIATEAVQLVSEYAFQELNLVRLYAGVFDFNKASQKVLEKAGFELEGILKKAIIKNNKILDECRYARINKNFLVL